MLETASISAAEREQATATASLRFPEIAVEQRFSARDDNGGRDIWVCRAPSAAHLRRWAEACRFALAVLQPIDTDRSPL